MIQVSVSFASLSLSGFCDSAIDGEITDHLSRMGIIIFSLFTSSFSVLWR